MENSSLLIELSPEEQEVFNIIIENNPHWSSLIINTKNLEVKRKIIDNFYPDEIDILKYRFVEACRRNFQSNKIDTFISPQDNKVRVLSFDFAKQYEYLSKWPKREKNENWNWHEAKRIVFLNRLEILRKLGLEYSKNSINNRAFNKLLLSNYFDYMFSSLKERLKEGQLISHPYKDLMSPYIFSESEEDFQKKWGVYNENRKMLGKKMKGRGIISAETKFLKQLIVVIIEAENI